MVLVIDNYDSFTYNLVQYLGELGADEIVVRRNDEISVSEAEALEPTHIVISPGPGRPEEAGISTGLIRRLSGRAPILGVCLGHQCLAVAYGGVVGPARRLVHGKTSSIHHEGSGLLDGLPNPLTATRYHSLAVHTPVPDVLQAVAWAEDGEVMALAHRSHPTYGLQFHPESILTERGHDILRNFLSLRGQDTARACPPNRDYL